MTVSATLMVDSQEVKASAKVSDKALELAFPDGKKRELRNPLPGFDSIDTALRELADGNFVVVLDNEDRENEGDLVIAADKVIHTPWLFCKRDHWATKALCGQQGKDPPDNFRRIGACSEQLKTTEKRG